MAIHMKYTFDLLMIKTTSSLAEDKLLCWSLCGVFYNAVTLLDYTVLIVYNDLHVEIIL
jgi:hypothetical protein